MKQIFDLPRFIGQDKVKQAILPFININAADLTPTFRPAGVFLLAGPTGTGKSFLVSALASELHGNSNHFLQINCTEYQEAHQISRLIGAPPGYLGHRETQPALSQAKIQQYRSEKSNTTLLLFDEFEKANKALELLLYNSLDKGELQLGDNSTVQLRNCMIFLTTNIGDKEIAQDPNDELAVKAKIYSHFSLPFLNRVDEIFVFKPLSPEAVAAIVEQELQNTVDFVKSRYRVNLTFSQEFKSNIASRNYSAQMGAREIKRSMWKQVLLPLSTWILENNITANTLFSADFAEINQFALQANNVKTAGVLSTEGLL